MFDSAKTKLDWANKHIRDFGDAFGAFVESHRYALSVHSDTDGTIIVDARFDQQPPPDLALMIADSVHNMRTALDHAMWELIGLDGGTQDRWTTLPTGNNRVNYEATCNGIKTPRDDTKEFFKALATYKGGGGNDVYGLHLLDNAEKHTIITPVIQVARIGRLRVVGPDGNTILTLNDTAVSPGPAGGRANVGTFGHGNRVEFDQDSNAGLDIFFGDVEVFRFEGVAPTLMHLSDAVADYLRQFENFVATRSP